VTLQTVVYVSAAAPRLSQRELSDLISQISEQCERENVTGLLLCRDGSFAGLLEGEVEPVMRVYHSVREDARQVHFTEVLCAASSSREFGCWSVAENIEPRYEAMPGLGRLLLTAMWAQHR